MILKTVLPIVIKEAQNAYGPKENLPHIIALDRRLSIENLTQGRSFLQGGENSIFWHRISSISVRTKQDPR
jgi:hypothetical protein